MDEPREDSVFEQKVEGVLSYSHVYDASDLLLALSPREDMFSRGQAYPVWSCHVWFCSSADMHRDGQGLIWRHRQQRTQKKLFPHLVLQRRCILVRVPHGVKDVTVTGVWTASGVKFSSSLSEHPLIHTDVPTCSDRPELLTNTALRQSVMNSLCKTLFTPKFIKSLINVFFFFYLILRAKYTVNESGASFCVMCKGVRDLILMAVHFPRSVSLDNLFDGRERFCTPARWGADTLVGFWFGGVNRSVTDPTKTSILPLITSVVIEAAVSKTLPATQPDKSRKHLAI